MRHSFRQLELHLPSVAELSALPEGKLPRNRATAANRGFEKAGALRYGSEQARFDSIPQSRRKTYWDQGAPSPKTL